MKIHPALVIILLVVLAIPVIRTGRALIEESRPKLWLSEQQVEVRSQSTNNLSTNRISDTKFVCDSNLKTLEFVVSANVHRRLNDYRAGVGDVLEAEIIQNESEFRLNIAADKRSLELYPIRPTIGGPKLLLISKLKQISSRTIEISFSFELIDKANQLADQSTFTYQFTDTP